MPTKVAPKVGQRFNAYCRYAHWKLHFGSPFKCTDVKEYMHSIHATGFYGSKWIFKRPDHFKFEILKG